MKRNINKIINYIKSDKIANGQDSFLTVEEALNLPMLIGYEVLGSKIGLQNKCKHMTILETPEGISWLEGGEFLVTAGYAYFGKDEIKQNIIVDAYKKGVSAIAIKDMRYFGKISDKLISDSIKYGIPIVKIPYNVCYTEMISNFYYLLFYRKNEYIMNLNNIYEKLLKLSFEDKEIDDIIYSLSNLSNSNVFLFDNMFNLVSQRIIDVNCYNKISKIVPFNKNGESILTDNEKLCINIEVNDSHISSYPILKKNKNMAFLYVVNEREIDELEQSAIEYGVSIISSKIEKNRLEKFSQPKYKKTLVDVMINNKELPSEFYSNVEKDIGWDRDGNVVGLCIKLDVINNNCFEDFNYILHNVLNEIKGHDNYLSTEKLSDIFIFIKLDEGNYIQEIINSIYDKINFNKSRFLVSMGVSNAYKGLQDIEKLYNESYLAVLFSDHDIIYFNSLDTIKLLYPLKDDDEIRKYYNKTIKKLEIYDVKHDTNLVETLETYFRYNLNNKVTASKLFIHIETLRYRLTRIEEISGYSPNNAEGIFALQMGIKLMRLIRLK